MRRYSETAWERMMKIQEVILRATAKRITWWQAVEILGISDRSTRHWKRRYEERGYDGLFDRRQQRPSPRRVPMEVAEEVLWLYFHLPKQIHNLLWLVLLRRHDRSPSQINSLSFHLVKKSPVTPYFNTHKNLIT